MTVPSSPSKKATPEPSALTTALAANPTASEQEQPVQEQPSLARRYMGKLLANIATVPVYLVMEAVLPRALGPQIYGNYNFAVSVFTQFTAFLDMGTSTCFYNALSRRQREHGLVAFYLRVTGLVLVITLLAGAVLLIPPLGERLLPDVPLWYAPLAAIFGFLLWGTRVVRAMNDALGLTVPGEMVRSVVNLGGAFLLLALFGFGWLNAGSLFGLQYLMMGGMVVGSLMIMRRCWPGLDLSLPKAKKQAYIAEFSDYSTPLFVQALLSALALWAERWVLQWFDGSTQQGYFALSQRVSMACFLFVSAMTPLIMRELAIAWGKDDKDHMGRILTRFAPLLFAVAAWFSCFTVMEASVLVHIFGGAEFAAALLPVQIMALYPAHQAYGQLASSVFHATGKTKILRNLAVVEHLGGFVLVWFLLAPPEWLGFGLGATGLAVKTVIWQCLMVNILLWLASHVIPLSFARNLVLQVVILGTLLLLAYASREVSLLVCGVESADTRIWLRFVCSGIIYGVASLALTLSFPSLVGCSRAELRELVTRFRRRNT